MQDRRPLGQKNYEEFAHRYSERLTTQPWNAYYERPATLSLVPDVAGRDVLDAGCGPGVYAEWLLARGARVVGLDVTPAMLALSRERLGDRAALLRANLERPLPFAAAAFDVVLCPLVLGYVKDWRPLFREFARVVRPGGTLVYSCGHPASDIAVVREKCEADADYFAVTRHALDWHGFGEPAQTITFYVRPLEETLNPLAEAGFVFDRILEPRATEQFRAHEPEDYERLERFPAFLCVRATRAG